MSLLTNNAAPESAAKTEEGAKTETPISQEAAQNVSFDVDLKERPDFIPEQFWNPDTQQIRAESFFNSFKTTKSAYDSMTSKFNNQQKELDAMNEMAGAKYEDPSNYLKYITEDGKYVLPEGVEKIKDVSVDDAALIAMANSAKSHGLTDKQFKGMVDDFVLARDKAMPAPVNQEEVRAQEMAKLGKDAHFIVDSLGTWLNNLKQTSKIDESSYNQFIKMSESADGVKSLYALRKALDATPSIPTAASQNSSNMTKEQWQNMMRDPRFTTDPEFKKKWHQLSRKLFD